MVLDNSMTVTRASYTGDIACPVSGCAILFSDIRRPVVLRKCVYQEP